MILSLGYRMWRTTDTRLLWKFAYNFGWKGMLSVQRFKKRLKQGQVFPPFLYVSIINSFAPQLNDLFDFTTFTSFSGAFTTTNGLEIGGGLELDLTYEGASARLTVVPDA